MKTITIVGYRRPHYFQKLLACLTKNELKNWRIYIQIDPSDKGDSMVQIAHEYLNNYDLDVTLNEERLGVKMNPYTLIDKVFKAGSTLNIHLEEDIEIAPDTTSLALWYEKQELSDVLCMNLVANGCFSAASVISYEANHLDALIKTKLFNSIGLILTNRQWEENIKHFWLTHDFSLYNYEGVEASGWDISLYAKLLSSQNLYSLSPLTPRASHIGKDDGEYCTQEFHDKAWGYIKLPERNLGHLNYRIIDKSELGNFSLISLLNSWDEIHRSLKTIEKQAVIIHNQALMLNNPFRYLYRAFRKLKETIYR
ncbi:MAG: hypothetical protein SFT68_02520 [Rickettsiaceae bacterium]|nr:hypothetical protein [Rickettsiaceae bacterium]